MLAWSLPAQVSAGEAPSEAPELPSEPSEPLLPAVQDAWLPGAGERSPATTLQPPHFLGMTYMFPLRLHLARGGHIDGALGGVDPEAGELLLEGVGMPAVAQATAGGSEEIEVQWSSPEVRAQQLRHLSTYVLQNILHKPSPLMFLIGDFNFTSRAKFT